jgi:hypothetical protein
VMRWDRKGSLLLNLIIPPWFFQQEFIIGYELRFLGIIEIWIEKFKES